MVLANAISFERFIPLIHTDTCDSNVFDSNPLQRQRYLFHSTKLHSIYHLWIKFRIFYSDIQYCYVAPARFFSIHFKKKIKIFVRFFMYVLLAEDVYWIIELNDIIFIKYTIFFKLIRFYSFNMKKMLNSFVGLWVFFIRTLIGWFVLQRVQTLVCTQCILMYSTQNIYHMQWTFFRMLILHSSRMRKLFPFECFHHENETKKLSISRFHLSAEKTHRPNMSAPYD